MSENRDKGDDLIAPDWLLWLLLVIAFYILMYAIWKAMT